MKLLKAYISVDLEGLPGVVSTTMLNPWSSQFSIASKIVTRLVNAVADELFKNGFSDVLIADSHGLMTNISYLELDGRVDVIQGYPRPFSMVSGLTNEYKAVFFVGYHSAAGTMHGVLEHTYSGRVFSEIRINGIRASEFLINSLYAGEIGVPVALLAGDEYLEKEVELYLPWVVFVPLKKGVSRFAAYYPSIEKAEKTLREGVKEACNRIRSGNLRVFQLEKPYRVELVFRESLVADALEAWDLMERVNAYTVRFYVDSAKKILGAIEIAAFVGSAVDSFKANIK
ncbi:MAG: M55 family metallopeptidase [Desulfurococcaceae archaeon]